jgi:multidrug resistance efflux pump
MSRARVDSASARVGSARANLQAAVIAYEKTYIRAPFAGAVLRKEAEVGEIVSPIPSSGGLTRGAIVTMANLASLQVDVDVNEGYVNRTREGMRTEIALEASSSPRESSPDRADRRPSKSHRARQVSFDSSTRARTWERR